MSLSIETREQAIEADRNDPLASFRDRFVLPDDVIYLDGNSLGPLPRRVVDRMTATIRDEWGEGLVRSWVDADWINLPEQVGDKIARLIGAGPDEVIAADSTSVNLFKLLSAALSLRPERRVIVSQKGNFPSDLYIAQGLSDLLDRGHELRLVDNNNLIDTIDQDTAVVMLTQVDYRSGHLQDMAAITAAAHESGALIIWDLAHSAGALPIDLNGAGADFAVGCGYKFLNGGPGAPGYLYVAQRHQDAIKPILSGWMGHKDRFAFDPVYQPADGIKRQLCGTPTILSLAALDEALDVMLEADIDQLRAKSLALSRMFIDLVECNAAGHDFELASPRDDARRGSQVSFHHQHGYSIVQALIARGVIGDFRAPDILRFGMTPLYTRYVDIWDAVAALSDVMATSAWDKPEFTHRAAVT